LAARDSDDVIAATKTWVSKLKMEGEDYQRMLLEALWVHQTHNVVDEGLLKQLLRSPEHRVRAAATRVLCFWRDQVKDPVKLLKPQITDSHPRVRLEAVRACSFFPSDDVFELVLEAADLPMDDYLDYCLDETLRALEAQ
jgi:hypothetical protein